MEDVRRRFGGMSFSGVPMNEMSEVERKIAEMKVGGDGCVDHATVLLGAMRFGGTTSSSPEKTVRATPSKTASRRRPDREGAAGIAGGDGAPNGLHDAGGGGGGDRDNVSARFQDAWTTNERVHPDLMRSSNASPAADPESRRPFEKRNLFHREGSGFDPSNAGATKTPRVSAMGEERAAAEKAFAALDQNSGRVSTPAFEELLTLLGVPAERRKGDATESARAAGLLSSYSFSRNDFMNWYLVWRFKGCAPGNCTPGASRNGCNGTVFPLPKFDSWKRSKPSFNSPTSSDSELSFSLKAAAAFRAAVAAVSASPDATDSSDHAAREAAGRESESKEMGKKPGVLDFETIRDILLDDSTSSASVTSAHGKRGPAEFNVGNSDPNRRSKSSHGSMGVPDGDRTGNSVNAKSKSGVDGIEERKTNERGGSAPGVSHQAPFRAANFTPTVAASDGLPQPQPSKEPLKFNCGAKAEQPASGLPSHRQNGRSNGGTSDKGPRILRRSAAALRKDRTATIGKLAADMTPSAAENMNVYGSTSNPVFRSGQTPAFVSHKEQPKEGRHAQAPQTIPATKATPAVCTPSSTAPAFVFGPAMTPTKPTVASPPAAAPLFNFGYSANGSVQPPPTPPSSTFSMKIAGGLPTTPLPTYAATPGEGTFTTGTAPRTHSSTCGRRRQRGRPSKASSLTPPPPPGRCDRRGGPGVQNGGTGHKATMAASPAIHFAAGIFASCFSPVASNAPSPSGIGGPLKFSGTAAPATEQTAAGPSKKAGVGLHNSGAPSNPSLKDDLVPNAWSTPEPARTYESYNVEAPSGDKFNVKRSAPGFHPGTTGMSTNGDGVSAPKSTIKRNNTGFNVGTTGTNKSTASRNSRASAKGSTSGASKSGSSASCTSTSPAFSKGVQSSRIFTFSVGNKGSKGDMHNSAQKVVQQQGGSQTDLKPPSVSTKDATEVETAVRRTVTNESNQQERPDVGLTAAAFRKAWVRGEEDASQAKPAVSGAVANESNDQERFEVGAVAAATEAFQKAWVRGLEQDRERQREEREREKRRKEAEAILAKLRDKHEADKERARRTYMELKSFEAAVVDYTDAINSLEDVMYHMKLHGDEHGETDVVIEERKRLAPLLWSRAAAHIMIGRYRSAVTDCALALEANKDFDQAYPRMGKALMMAGDLEEAEQAFFLGIRQDPCPEDLRNHKDCRDGIVNLETIRAHLENAKRNLDGKQHMRAIASADRALTSSPNLEGAQTLIVKVLMKDKKWEETRRRCEVWAYKLDSSNCVGKIMSLQGFAEGGGPPRACLRNMYASLREPYVKSLRNAGLTDAFKEALDEATTTGVVWATAMTRRRQQVMEKKERAGEEYASKQYRIAEELYTEALAIDGEDFHTNALLHANRAAARMNLGRNKDALKDCEQALRLKPMYPKMLLRKARLQKRLCYWEEAIKNFESYRNTVGILHETWREAAAELDECRLNLRKARDEERRKEESAGARFRSRDHSSRKTNFDDDYFPSGSDGEYDDPFNFFNRARAFRSGRRAGGRYGARSEESVTTPSSGHYATLGLQSSATIAEVKKAYRKLALQHHPDKNQGNADAADRFREITAAYEVLSDEKERRTYDATLRSLAHLRG